MALLMALDVGEVRIGVAVSDASGFLASPYTTLAVSRNQDQTWAEIQQLLSETEAEELLVGLPISLDGQIHAQGKRIQTFVERLKQHIAIPIILWDERFSTVEAERLLAERDQDTQGKLSRRRSRRRTTTGNKQRRQGIDALAAAVILQDYLDHRQSQQTKDTTL